MVVWLGGHGRHYHDTRELNMAGDVAAARVVMSGGVPFEQLPCMGAVSEFRLSGPELEHWLAGQSPLADYLARNTREAAERCAKGKPWSRVIWDVTAVAWLLNKQDRFLHSRLLPMELPGYDGRHHPLPEAPVMRYVYSVRWDELMEDLINKIVK